MGRGCRMLLLLLLPGEWEAHDVVAGPSDPCVGIARQMAGVAECKEVSTAAAAAAAAAVVVG